MTFFSCHAQRSATVVGCVAGICIGGQEKAHAFSMPFLGSHAQCRVPIFIRMVDINTSVRQEEPQKDPQT